MYKIIWLEDESDCEDCGPSYAAGYRIYKGKKVVVDKTPSAHCFDSQEFLNPYADILELEGILFEEEGL